MKESFLGALDVVQVLSAVLVFLLGIGLLAVAVMYVIDVTQTKSAIRRNFPVVGRFRYFFENLGEYFRQYFFAQDREEMPFNRAQRSWVYRAAKDIDNTVAFGSTRDLRPVGTGIFVNCPYPVLEVDMSPTSALTIGLAGVSFSQLDTSLTSYASEPGFRCPQRARCCGRNSSRTTQH